MGPIRFRRHSPSGRGNVDGVVDWHQRHRRYRIQFFGNSALSVFVFQLSIVQDNRLCGLLGDRNALIFQRSGMSLT